MLDKWLNIYKVHTFSVKLNVFINNGLKIEWWVRVGTNSFGPVDYLSEDCLCSCIMVTKEYYSSLIIQKTEIPLCIITIQCNKIDFHSRLLDSLIVLWLSYLNMSKCLAATSWGWLEALKKLLKWKQLNESVIKVFNPDIPIV